MKANVDRPPRKIPREIKKMIETLWTRQILSGSSTVPKDDCKVQNRKKSYKRGDNEPTDGQITWDGVADAD